MCEGWCGLDDIMQEASLHAKRFGELHGVGWREVSNEMVEEVVSR